VWVDPGGDVPPHFHPAQEERFEVVAGRVRFRTGRARAVHGPGDRVTAPPRVVHAFENIGNEEAHLRVEVVPALHLQDTLEEAAALARAGKYTRRGIPKGFRAAIEMADFVERHGDETVLVSPPRFLQRLLLAPLARLARRRRADVST
jgi:oxalate decarboxylase/phosphoglucose isomerase-like protein (cupin superfamily)